MAKPSPFPPLRIGPAEAKATVTARRAEGADLFVRDNRYTSEMHDRFETWYQSTAADLQLIFWSDEVAKWFREGTCWLVGAGSYPGIIATRDDRLKVLDQILSEISPQPTLREIDAAQYDVCLSFAGEQRSYVEQVAVELVKLGIRAFYDRYEQIDLWGKDLYEHLNSVYRDRARFCVIFISKDYASKQWTSHERKSAQARAFRESREYILPTRFDDTELPGLNETLGYIDLRQTTPKQLAELVVKKVERAKSPSRAVPSTDHADSSMHALQVSQEVALEAVWKRRDVRIESERHEYRLLIDLHNVGRRKISDWRIQVWFPNAFLSDTASRVGESVFEEHDGHYSEEGKRLLPGDKLHVLDIDYFVDNTNWPSSPFLPEEKRQRWKVRIRVSADGMIPWETDIPMGKLQNF